MPAAAPALATAAPAAAHLFLSGATDVLVVECEAPTGADAMSALRALSDRTKDCLGRVDDPSLADALAKSSETSAAAREVEAIFAGGNAAQLTAVIGA